MDKFNIAWIPVLKSWQYSKMEDVEIPAKKLIGACRCMSVV